jgi:hypothetical protein
LEIDKALEAAFCELAAVWLKFEHEVVKNTIGKIRANEKSARREASRRLATLPQLGEMGVIKKSSVRVCQGPLVAILRKL